MSDYSSEDVDKNPLRCGSATRAFEMHIWQGDWGFYTQFKLCHPRWQNMSKVRLADGMQSHLSAVCDIESWTPLNVNSNRPQNVTTQIKLTVTVAIWTT